MKSGDWASNFLQMLSYSEATQALARYWLSVPRREGEICPRRSDFRLTEIAQYLDEIYMSQWVSHESLIILASGSKLVDILGEDITGKNIYGLVPTTYSRPQMDYYNALHDQPCAGALTRWGASLKERPFVYRTMQLPLSGDTGEVQFFVGTGVIRTTVAQGDRMAAYEDRINVEQHERIFIDIGAGVPDES